MLFNNSKKEIAKLTERIYKLEEENKHLKSIYKLNRFYSDICLNINNNNKYLDILEKINNFYLINNLKSKGISNKDIDNHIKGKKGEIYLLNTFNEYIKNNRKLEYFYDFNIQNESQNLQFDFLAIAKNNIYIIEVKNLNAKELELCKNEKGYYYIKAHYDNDKSYNITFSSMTKRYKLIDEIIKKFQAKHNYIHFNVFNMMIFIEGKELLFKELLNNKKDDDIDYKIEIPMINGKLIQVLLGKENINEYFCNYTSKIYNNNYDNKENSVLNDFSNFIKSDISFRESTDKNYIIQRVYEFFEQVYKCIENEKLNLKFD